jgi:hypothetical protein
VVSMLRVNSGRQAGIRICGGGADILKGNLCIMLGIIYKLYGNSFRHSYMPLSNRDVIYFPRGA